MQRRGSARKSDLCEWWKLPYLWRCASHDSKTKKLSILFNLLVPQECTSNDELPQTHIEYDESEVSCNSFNNNVVEKSLSLGILCGEDYFFEDLFLECGVGNELRRDGANRFTCFSPQTTIPATADNTLYLVNSTEIMTDYRWPLWAPQICPHQGTRRLRGRH